MTAAYIKKDKHNYTGLILALIIGCIIVSLPLPDNLSLEGQRTGAVVLMMVICWLSESIPIPVTALLPLIFFPILNINPIKDTASHYSHPIIFMFLGGFMLALSMQHWQLHRRIALNIIIRVGSKPRSLILGFMIATAFLSMWISNTATTLMMLPIALSLTEINHQDDSNKQFTTALLLAIAYSASIGGMSTIIGTPPNAFMIGFIYDHLHLHIGFSDWLWIGLPITLIGIVLTFLLLTFVLFKLPRQGNDIDPTYLEQHLALLGPIKTAERRVLAVFTLTVLLWLSRSILQSWLPGLSDAGIAIFAGVLLFTLPSGDPSQARLLKWPQSKELPWGLLLLFGGALSMSNALNQTGLAAWLGQFLTVSPNVPVIIVMLMVSAIMLFLTELATNTAATATFLPIVVTLADNIGISPLLLVIPATLSSSCAFMLPIATPPNAIVFASDKVSMQQMMRAGFYLNMIFCFLITAVCYWYEPILRL